MKFQSYLVCWDDYLNNALEIEKQFSNVNLNLEVINSGTPKDGWINVGDIRYFKQLYYVLKNFDYSNDYLVFIAADISQKDWSVFMNRAKEVLSNYKDIYLYAPYFTNDPWGQNSTMIESFVYDKDLFVSTNTNGMLFFMHKNLVKKALDFFDYFENNYGWEGMVSGWAVDVVFSAMAISENKLILRDSKYILNHPKGSSYDHSKATHESNLVYQAFKSFAGEEISSITSKIYDRMSHAIDSMKLNYFYKNIDLNQYVSKINYHIITINDERIENKDIINNLFSEQNNINIKSLNAKDNFEVENFHQDYPKFKFGWHSFKPGEFGNFASHYMAWKYLLNSDLDSLLIFEDDALIKNNFIQSYKLLIDQVPDDYDVFSVYIDDNQYPRYEESYKINESISIAYQDWSTLCYVVSKKGAQAMCSYVESVGMDRPTDWFIFRGGQEGKFKVYSINPEVEVPLSIDKRYQSQVQ